MAQRRRKCLLGAFAAAALVAGACGDGARFVAPDVTAAPDDAITTFVGPNGLPAVAVAVVDGGAVLYSRVAGTRKRGSNVAVMDDDPFLIGSNTKAMTALVAGTVVDAGQISWESTVGAVLGSTLTVGAPYRDVTLSQLLGHRSGLPHWLSDADWATFFTPASVAAPVAAERRRLVELVLALTPAFAPDTDFLYTNLGYWVAAEMLEVVTGKTWETLVRERLFEPLAMSRAGIGLPATPSSTIDAPWGHDPAPHSPDKPTFAAAAAPSATVHANLSDLLRYVQLYFDAGRGPNGVILSPASLTDIETPRINDFYGFGWTVTQDAAGRKVLVHDGTDRTFYSSIVVIPERRAAVIVLSNQGDPEDDGAASSLVGQVNTYLFGHFLHCDGKSTSFPPGARTTFLLAALCEHDSSM